VSILKPLKGADAGIEENLASFFALDYPDFELIFSIADPRDPVRPVVLRLMERHPSVRARLIEGAVDAGPNPKVNNLIRSYDLTRHDLVLISDSNIRVEPRYLKRLIAHLDNGVGVITAVVAGVSPERWGGRLEAMYLNTFYARFMRLASLFGHPCVVGKSMLFRKSVAKRFGGIATLSRYLAEDYMTGIAMQKLGLKAVIMSDPVEQHIGRYSFGDFWARHVRWGRIRKAQAPVAFGFEPLSGSVLSAIFGAIAGHALWADFSLGAFLFAHFGIWAVCDLRLNARMAGEGMRRATPAWLLREALSFPLWVHAVCGNTVLWRGRKFKVASGGLLHTGKAS
jgi:ceramide glucosyltransferase